MGLPQHQIGPDAEEGEAGNLSEVDGIHRGSQQPQVVDDRADHELADGYQDQGGHQTQVADG